VPSGQITFRAYYDSKDVHKFVTGASSYYSFVLLGDLNIIDLPYQDLMEKEE
jgi:hypothetical protein